jgi:diguanylate cyclase (GGDEF)-like protein
VVVADPRRGTVAAAGLTLLAALACLSWAHAVGWDHGLSAFELASLLVVAGVAERIVVPLGARTDFTFSTPIVLLAGLLGGPLVGAAAGVATGIATIDHVWRRRLTYGALTALQGFVAGLAGPLPTPEAALSAAALAAAAAILVSLLGRVAVRADRGIRPLVATAGMVAECAEAIVVVPLLALLVTAFATQPLLVLLAVLSLLTGAALVQPIREHHARQLTLEWERARRDTLTGAANRLGFQEALAAEHARVVRGSRPAALLVIDIDRFKAVNDLHGHEAGDRTLVTIVDRLRAVLRGGDLIARWGGEELVVLAPGLDDPRQLAVYADRIRCAIGDRSITLGSATVEVTASVGAALLDGGSDPYTAMRRADAALYLAKDRRDAAVVDAAALPTVTVAAT